MNPKAEVKALAVSERIFRRLLAAYPKAHREEYGTAMSQLFRDQCRDAWSESRHWGLAKLWLRVLPDVVGTSFIEHLETIKERKFMLNRIGTIFRSAQFVTVFTAVFLLVVIAATVVTFILPESYVGTARISVAKAQDRSNANVKPGKSMTGNSDPHFIQTELEIMQSQFLLGKVVENPTLNLRQRWGTKYHAGGPLKTQEAIELLKHFISITPLRDTRLIETRVYSDQPEEAAMLANELVEAYRDYRLEQTNQNPVGMVEIVDRAMPNPIPVAPNKPLYITSGVVLGILLGLLAGGGAAGISFWRRQSAQPKIAT